LQEKAYAGSRNRAMKTAVCPRQRRDNSVARSGAYLLNFQPANNIKHRSKGTADVTVNGRRYGKYTMDKAEIEAALAANGVDRMNRVLSVMKELESLGLHDDVMALWRGRPYR
jgi:hypothetical protein